MLKRNITTRHVASSARPVSWAITLLAFGAFGCAANNNSTASDESDSSAVKAASPACSSARDACKSSIDAIIAPVQSACEPVETACDHRPAGKGGAAGTTGAAGAAGSDDCSTARAACKAAIVAALPQVESAGKDCQQSIDQACVIPRPDAGATQGAAGRGGEARGGHEGRPEPSAACEDAEDACRSSLQSLRTMPPASCSAVADACTGQTPATATDACKAAVDTCRTDVEAAEKSAHDGCGTSIVAACSPHAG